MSLIESALPQPLRRQNIALRRETDEDMMLLRALYADHRADELAQMAWPAAMREQFLRSQFDLQYAHFQTHYGDADFMIVTRGAAPIGRLYVDRTADRWLIVDITLALPARNAGIGSALIRWLIKQAPAVQLSVARDNIPARRLYERLGFREIFGTSATHIAMRWAS